MTLTTLHLAYASLGTRLLRRFTHLLDGLDRIDMSWDRYLRNIVPIGALFSASLVFSNLAYITLEVSFIQMLKAFVAVVVYFMSVFMVRFPSPLVVVVVVVLTQSAGSRAIQPPHRVHRARHLFRRSDRLVRRDQLVASSSLSPQVLGG